MKLETIVFIILLATATSFGDSALPLPPKDFKWPSSATAVKLISIPIDCQWREGRPMASRAEVARLLHISDQGSQLIDLIDTLTEKGWLVRWDRGQIQAINPSSAATANQGGAVNEDVRARNAAEKIDYENKKAAEAHEEAIRPRLVFSIKRVFIADTEFIRAEVVVTNKGGSPSKTCTAVGHFVDWYQHPFAEHKLALGPLRPGESRTLMFFSLIHKDEQNPNGVIKADKYTIQVKFE